MRPMIWLSVMAAVGACGKTPEPPSKVSAAAGSTETQVGPPSSVAVPAAPSAQLGSAPAGAVPDAALAEPGQPPAAAKPVASKPTAQRSQPRCIQGLKRALVKAAKLEELPEGESEDGSSGDAVQIAYFVVDADVRSPWSVIRVGAEAAKPPSSPAATWRTAPGLPSWFDALKPPSSPQAMPIRWPSDHLERHRGGLVGTIVTMSSSKKVETVLEAAVDACMQAWQR